MAWRSESCNQGGEPKQYVLCVTLLTNEFIKMNEKMERDEIAVALGLMRAKLLHERGVRGEGTVHAAVLDQNAVQFQSGMYAKLYWSHCN